VPRNARTYEHFCVLARAMERVGERWSLLVVRDLLSGPKRFTDLMDRCAGITPKTLTQRLRELQDAGILTADRVAGRREVRYQLTAAGAALAPAVHALTWWGLQHAWRPPHPGEPLHPEHLLHALAQVLNHTGHRQSAHWHLTLDRTGSYHLHTAGTGGTGGTGGKGETGGAGGTAGTGWTLSTNGPGTPPDVTITCTASGWTAFITEPTARRATELGIDIHGAPAARRTLYRLLRALPATVPLSGTPAR
jgi:DNA-binding HxlR family transcriptional regulator